VDVGLWLYEIDSIRSRTDALQRDYEIAKHELEMAEDSLQGLERQSERLLERLKENKEKSESARKEFALLTEQRHEAESAIMLCENNYRHSLLDEERLKGEIAKKEDQGKGCSLSVEQLHRTTAEQKEAIKRSEEALLKVQIDIDGIRARFAALSEEKTAAEREIEEAKDALQQHKLQLSALEGSKSGEKERKEELEEQAEELTLRIKKTGEGLLRAEEDLEKYREKITECKEKITVLDEKLSENEGTEKETVAKTGALQVQQNTVSERIRLLRRMDEHFEGYAGSVRHVMTKAASGALSGICGPVSKLISVNEQYAPAIEVALGGSLQHIVTEDERAAKAAIEELKRSNNGRATFYPLSAISPKPLEIDKKRLSAMKGFIGIASELVRCEDKHKKAIEYLLCRTVICDTLDHATDISSAFGRAFKLVSLDGQVINAGGSYTGGSLKKDGGILSRGAEIKRLEKEAEQLSKELLEKEKRIASIKEERRQLESEKDRENGTLDILTVMYNSEDTDCKVRRAKMESDRSQLASIEESLLALKDQMANFFEEKKGIERAIEEASLQIEEKKSNAEAVLSRIAELEQARDLQIEEKNRLILEKNFLLKDLASNENEIEKTLLQMMQLQKEAKEAQTALEALAEEKKESRLKERQAKELCEKLTDALASLKAADADLEEENKEFEKQSEQIRLQQKDKTRHREILLRDYTRLDGALESIKTEQERYTARLWDEYELTYAASKELGVPEITESFRAEAVSRQNKLKNRIRDLGAVNVGAIEEYADVKERFDFLSAQHADLIKAREELGAVIVSLEKEMKSRFAEIFNAINENFRLVFAELFGGGTAELSLNDPENILESGIEISVAPPGKIIKSLSLLSGGEQVFVAIALFFAILRVNPAPFCLLDEIEAALDEVNVARFASYAKNYSDKTQFIIISHRRGTMEEADTMYGVTMGERGISRVLPLHLNEVESKIGLMV
ncbi:MAG: chromosome segregation protein SMC, partial [Clostridia bacterium]|nr:chromosome segregation protein SMC [Clostridia bacterium]